MKQLTCEMCGSTDLMKQDGVFVCQSCGTKYSIEEAKKMMVEGTVDVSGSTVKVDHSDELEHLYILARRAKANNNSADALKYYQEIIKKEPNSWEANFGVVYYTAATCTVGQIESAAQSVSRNLENVFSLIELYEDDKEKDAARGEVFIRVLALADSFQVSAKEAHKSQSQNMSASSSMYSDVMTRFFARSTASFKMLNALAECFIALYDATGNDDYIQRALIAFKRGQAYLKETYTESLYKSNPKFIAGMKNITEPITSLIQKYEPNYQDPLANIEKPSGGCYVATAVYGSYDCPQVWTLRRYRDYTLAETWYGRAFIHTYYAISPTIVKWFGHTEWFKKMWKGKLDRMVANLNAEGVEDTPYKDKLW